MTPELDRFLRPVHDAVVRRVISLVLALVVALWLPVQQPVSREEMPRQADPTAQTERPPSATDFSSWTTAGAPGTSQTWLAHDVLKSQSASWLPGNSPSVRVPVARVGAHSSSPPRTFPLLI